MNSGKYVRAAKQTENDNNGNSKVRIDKQSEAMHTECEAVDRNNANHDTDMESDSDSNNSYGSSSESDKSGRNDSGGDDPSDDTNDTDIEQIISSVPEKSVDVTAGTKTNAGNNANILQPCVVGNSSAETANERMDRIEKVLECMASAMKSLQTYDRPTSSHREAEPNSSMSMPIDTPDTIEKNPSIIRWDNIQPFPPGIPANRMWEEWNKYIENFEIAALLSNANEPGRRTQLLFLPMGPDLQEIVRAAKLRPSLTDINCY